MQLARCNSSNGNPQSKIPAVAGGYRNFALCPATAATPLAAGEHTRGEDPAPRAAQHRGSESWGGSAGSGAVPSPHPGYVRDGRYAFTLVELLISIAVLALLATFIVSGLAAYRESAALDQAVDEALGLLREARALALASEGASSSGVYFASTSVALFPGGAYSDGNPLNTVVALPPGVTVSSLNLSTTTASVVFERLSGESRATGTVTFSTARSSKTKQIQVLSSGVFRKR